MFRIKCEDNVVVYVNENMIKFLVHYRKEKVLSIVEPGTSTPMAEFYGVIEVERMD